MTEQMYFNWQGCKIPLDKNGYLQNVNDWHEDMVPALAAEESIILTEDHWQVIRFVRQFYLDYDTSPAIRALVNAMKQSYGPEKGNSRYLQRLFPKGPAKQATRLAGLPKPAKCL